MNRQSAKRRKEMAQRAVVRDYVLSRDPQCQAHGMTLQWPSGKVTECAGRSTEVHELKRGKMRRDCYLNAEMCLGLCAPCHSWVTLNPIAAVNLGLAMWSWEEPSTNPTEGT